MIPRYSRPDMVAIWSPETRFKIWFEIEAHACDAQAALGVIPKANAEAVWRAKDVEFNVARIDEIEAVTKHDVIAFLTHLAEHIGADEARFVHQGMTSSDVLDTALNIQLVRASDLLLMGLDRVLAALKARAFEHKDTVRIGLWKQRVRQEKTRPARLNSKPQRIPRTRPTMYSGPATPRKAPHWQIRQLRWPMPSALRNRSQPLPQ